VAQAVTVDLTLVAAMTLNMVVLAVAVLAVMGKTALVQLETAVHRLGTQREHYRLLHQARLLLLQLVLAERAALVM
jgi:hypothetical protein